MRYYKDIKDEIIIGVGTGDAGGTEIDKEEYDQIKQLINEKPDDTELYIYVLKTDLTWEQQNRPSDIPYVEPTYTLDEAATLLAQEVSQ